MTHRNLFLHTSPEYHMKRALARYSHPIFQICRCFRDEQASRLHHPEFMMLEWYRPDADFHQLMDDCDQLLSVLAETLLEGAPLSTSAGQVLLTSGCERVSVSEAFSTHAGLDPLELVDTAEFRTVACSNGYDVPEHWSWEDIFHFILLEAVESKLGQGRPTILFGYPKSLAGLSRVVDGVAERFELYIAGHELANAFSELVDSAEQRRRFESEQALRRHLAKPVYPIDDVLLGALDQITSAAGIALGIDRFWLLFAEDCLGERLELTDSLFLGL